MSQDKDEIVKMAREAGAVFDPQRGIASNTGTATFERFAALCRAPLVEEVERLKKDLSTYDKRIVALSCIAMEDVHELLALQADRDDWKARALKAEQAGEADELLRNLGLDPNAYRTEGGHINHLKVKAAIKHPEDYIPQCQHAFAMSASYGGKLCKHCGKPEPQPAAQEPTSAVPVVEETESRDAAFEAVRKLLTKVPRYSFHIHHGLLRRAEDQAGNWIEFEAAHKLFDPVVVDAAIAAGQQYLKENRK